MGTMVFYLIFYHYFIIIIFFYVFGCLCTIENNIYNNNKTMVKKFKIKKLN